MGILLENIFGFPRVPMQRAYNWDFILPSFGLIIDGIAISKFCQSCRFGQYNLGEPELFQVGAYKKFYPGLPTIDTVTATFVTPIPDIVSLYFVNWKKRIVDDQGFYSPSSQYKKNIYIILYDRTGIPVNFIQLNRSFPVKYPAYELDYQGEKMVQYNVEFRVDHVRMGTEALGEMGSIGKIASSVVKGVSGAVKGIVGF